MTKWWDHAARPRGLRQPTARRAVDSAHRAHEEPAPLLDEAAEGSGDHEFVFPPAKQIGIPIRRHSMSQVMRPIARPRTSPPHALAPASALGQTYFVSIACIVSPFYELSTVPHASATKGC